MTLRNVIATSTLLLGLAASQTTYFHSKNLSSLPRSTGIWVAIAFVIALTVILQKPVRWTANACKTMSRRSVILSLAIAYATGWLATYAIPVHVAPASRPVEVVVTATGNHSPAAKGAEVWVQLMADGVPVPATAVTTDGPWQSRGAWLVSASTEATRIHWKGTVSSSLKALFVSHPWSGEALVDVNGISQKLDLYADTSSPPREIQLLPKSDPRFLSFPQRTPLQRWVQVCDAALIGSAVFTLFLWLSCLGARPLPAPNNSRRYDALRFGAPSIICSAALLAIFYPGLMSSDSIDQWNQASTGAYNDWHPFYHSLAIASLRHLSDSPAIVASLQSVLLGLATGWLIAATLYATGAPRLLAHLAAWLCALCPVIAVSSITLWKDIPYSASVVAITAGCLSVAHQQRLRLNCPTVFISSIIVLVACMLLRHNGPPIALAALAFTWILAPELRKTITAMAVIVVALFLLLRGPVPEMFHVRRTNVLFTIGLHHIAAHLAAGETPPQEKNITLLQNIRPEGPLRYNCATVDTTIFDPAVNTAVASANTAPLLSLESQMAKMNFMTEIRHQLCVSGLVWRITVDKGQPLYLSTFSLYEKNGRIRWIAANTQGLTEHSWFPALSESLGAFVLAIKSDLILRPAIYMYLLIFSLIVAWRRLGDWRIVASIGLAPLIHCAVLSVANVAQDARYQLPIYIVALATTPLLLRARPHSNTPTEASSLIRAR